jgi:ketosteroid isomerase-like protein
MSTVDVKGILHEWAEAWSAHDIERVAAIFADDCVYEDVTFGASIVAKKNSGPLAAASWQRFPTFAWN